MITKTTAVSRFQFHKGTIKTIMGHVCALHGVQWKFSIKKMIIVLLKRKSPDLGDAVEEAMETDENNGK